MNAHLSEGSAYKSNRSLVEPNIKTKRRIPKWDISEEMKEKKRGWRIFAPPCERTELAKKDGAENFHQNKSVEVEHRSS